MHDLSKYSLAKLRALEVQINEELRTRHFLSISEAREQILHIARSAGISERELLRIKAPKITTESTAKVKYRNPSDSAQQWSGRGRKPAWVKAWIAAGKSIEDTKVN
jgi:DNA-binding protein H-NS